MRTLTIELLDLPGVVSRARFQQAVAADELDKLIAALGRMRADMSPPVMEELPDGHAIPNLQVELWSRGEVSRDIEGTVLMLRDSRFGWLAYRLKDLSRAWLLGALMDEEEAAQRDAQTDKGKAH